MPPSVQLRVLVRQNGKCAITGRKFRHGDAKQLDHTIPRADGGENREGNLQWILADKGHKPKTATEASERAKVRAKARADAGIKAPLQRPMESRNELAREKTKKPAYVPTVGMPGIWRRFKSGG